MATLDESWVAELCVKVKLRQLGPTNWIIDNSDYKPSLCERWYMYNSKSDVNIGFSFKDGVKIHLIVSVFE